MTIMDFIKSDISGIGPTMNIAKLIQNLCVPPV